MGGTIINVVRDIHILRLSLSSARHAVRRYIREHRLSLHHCRASWPFIVAAYTFDASLRGALASGYRSMFRAIFDVIRLCDDSASFATDADRFGRIWKWAPTFEGRRFPCTFFINHFGMSGAILDTIQLRAGSTPFAAYTIRLASVGEGAPDIAFKLDVLHDYFSNAIADDVSDGFL